MTSSRGVGPPTDEDAERQIFTFSLSPATNVYARSRKAMASLCRAFKWKDVHAHDARRTFATGLGELGVPLHTISAWLNHTPGGPVATRIYARYRGDTEKREAFDKWAARIDFISKSKGADVVPMPSQQATGTA